MTLLQVEHRQPGHGAALLAPRPEITPDLARLLHMLSFRRPAGSDTERRFVERFIDPHGPAVDEYGNRWLQNGDAPEIMWSCHTDSVHRGTGRQRLHIEGALVFAAHSSCLGADDAAGVWLALEMYQAGVPGLYAFHRDEEIGGGGSQYAAANVQLPPSIRAAIAFDRKGYGDVITHQFGRCCSDAFARSLAAILGGAYRPDDTGLFTDTANYTDVIGECSNISVGYHDAHGPGESLDLAFVRDLKRTLIEADWSRLTFERQPGEADPDRWAWNAYGSKGAKGFSAFDRWGERDGAYRDRRGESDYRNLVELCTQFPEAAASLLRDLGCDSRALEDVIWLGSPDR